MTTINSQKRQQFITDGFCRFPNILDSKLIAQLNNISNEVLSAQEQAHFEQQRTTGSMVLIESNPIGFSISMLTPCSSTRYTSGACKAGATGIATRSGWV